MNHQTLIKTGIIGGSIAAVCCATPVLVLALGAVGLSALTGYLDYVLLPALALCIGVIGYGLYRRRRTVAAAVDKTITRT